MPRPLKREHTTSVGTVVQLKYEIVDDKYVRILEYRHRTPGHTQFRNRPEWVGQLVLREQLPWTDEGKKP